MIFMNSHMAMGTFLGNTGIKMNLKYIIIQQFNPDDNEWYDIKEYITNLHESKAKKEFEVLCKRHKNERFRLVKSNNRAQMEEWDS